MLWLFFVFLSSHHQDRHVAKGDARSAAVNTTMSVAAGGASSLYYRGGVPDGRREARSVVYPRADLVDVGARVRSFTRHLGGGADHRFARVEEEAAEFTRGSARAERTPLPPPLPPPPPPVKRSKRGFTYPGTLWCGAGNMADHDDHLGDFAETDSCCRTHDHCPHVIHAFSSKYGYTNFKWHSICHCDCDIAMKQCLRKVNDTASRVVGQAFFNVIEVPCFEFVYEDHCVERHWYGLCKRYEKLPVAVTQPAIPYDFGGIDIIDVLTLAPPVKKNTLKVDEQARQKSTAPPETLVSRTSGPVAGESSLVTMVTAAEDFIKVLATVSTSQSSPVDAAKGAMPTAEEKKKKKKQKNLKNSGKRKKSQSHGKRKGKGRGRKVKLHTDTEVEDVLVASSSKAGVGNNFITELKTGRLGQNKQNRFVEGGFELAKQEGAANEVMKDEPAVDKDAAEVTSPSAAVPKEQVTQPTDLATVSTGSAPLPVSTSPTATTPRKTKGLMSRKGERRRKKIPKSDSYSPPDNAGNITLRENPSWSSTISLVNISAPGIVAVNPTAQLGQKRSKGHFESESFLTTARTPIVTHQTKRNRPGEGMAGERRKKRRKLANAVPIVSVDHKVPTEESVKVIGSIGVPIASSIPPTKRPEPNVSHRPEMYGAKSTATVTPAPSRSGFKTKGQRLKGMGRQRRRGKSAPSPFNGNPLLEKSSEHVGPTSMSVLFGISTTTITTVVTNPCKEVQRSRERGLQHARTDIPFPFSAATQRRTRRKGDKTRKKKPLLCVLHGDASPTPSEATHEPGTFTRFNVSTMASKVDKQEKPNAQISENTFFVTTTRAPALSPMQLSIQRAKEQFDFKKRRKSLLFLRQQEAILQRHRVTGE